MVRSLKLMTDDELAARERELRARLEARLRPLGIRLVAATVPPPATFDYDINDDPRR